MIAFQAASIEVGPAQVAAPPLPRHPTRPREATSAMLRSHLLLALLAAALASRADAVLPTTCPANGATHCSYGVTPSIPLTPMNVTTLLALQNSVPGANFATGSVALCSSITFVCNGALQLLYLGSPAVVRSFASACMASPTNATFVASGKQYTAYGTFLKSDCDNLVGGLAAVLAGPTAALVMTAIPNMVVCGTDYCTTPSSGAGGAAGAHLALMAAALAALAALL